MPLIWRKMSAATRSYNSPLVHLQSRHLTTALSTTFNTPSAVRIRLVLLLELYVTMSTMSRSPSTLSPRLSLSSYKASVALYSLPTWKNYMLTWYGRASALSSPFAILIIMTWGELSKGLVGRNFFRVVFLVFLIFSLSHEHTCIYSLE